VGGQIKEKGAQQLTQQKSLFIDCWVLLMKSLT
jgi:hypothetical protein